MKKSFFAVFLLLFWAGLGRAQTMTSIGPTPICYAVLGYTSPATGVYSFTSWYSNTSYPGTGQPVKYLWNFGDGVIDTGATPTHTYLNGGTYKVTMVASDGCEAADTQFVTVPGPGPASFNCANINVSFTDSLSIIYIYQFAGVCSNTNSASASVSYVWDFGDGSPLTVPSSWHKTSHVFAAAGTYCVKLITSWSSSGTTLCQDTETRCITVPPSVICNASFTYTSPSQGTYDLESNSTPNTVYGNPNWNLGLDYWWDKVGSIAPRSTWFTSSDWVIYPSPGTYQVILSVSWPNGCRDADTQNITVVATSPANFNCANVNASFTDSAISSSEYLFTGTTSNTNTAGSTLTHYWDFDDGSPIANTSYSPSIYHNFIASGTHCVKLIAEWSSFGTILCRDTAIQCITVNIPPFVCDSVSASFIYTNSGSNYYFSSTTTNPNVLPASLNYEWNYGDGSPLDTFNWTGASHTYNAFGTYNVRMIALYDSSGVIICRDTAIQTITVTPPPFNCATVYTDYLATLSGNTYTFSNVTTNPNAAPSSVSYEWDFGDGTPIDTTSVQVSHTYTLPGLYDVKLRATWTNNGVLLCQDSMVRSYPILAPPFNCTNVNASFTTSNTGTTYNFFNTTTNTNTASTSVNYEWDYGDNSPLDTTASLQTNHTYTTAGTYNARMIALYDSSGVIICRDTAMQSITISPVSLFDCANVNAAFTTSNSGATYTFTDASTNTNTLPVIASYSWNFGDGTTSGASSPNHTYTSSGSYFVTLDVIWIDTATNTTLCTNSTSQNLNVTVNQIVAQADWSSSTQSAVGASIKFWLITYDSSTQMLTAVDSALEPCLANFTYTYATWSNVPTGDYRVKAHMINQPSSLTTGFLPTYSISAFYWQNASVVNHTNGSDYTNIYLQQGTPMTGPGFIGGLVTQGANKGTAVGDPIPNLTVFLRDAANNPIASTETDANGNYSFSGVPIGSYSVYPEALSFATTPSANLQITATTTSLIGNDFKYEPGMQQINPVPQGVINPTVNEIIVSPNPVKDILTIQFAQTPEKGAVIRLLNGNGQVVRTEAAAPTMQINISGLAAGMYLLQVPGTSATYRIAVQK